MMLKSGAGALAAFLVTAAPAQAQLLAKPSDQFQTSMDLVTALKTSPLRTPAPWPSAAGPG